MKRPIYLDHHATTPVDPQVLEAMLPYFSHHFGNPSSTTHLYGWEATAAIDQSRAVIAEAIAASPEEIIFTSGATEANNLAIKGIAEAYFDKGRHFITATTEHSAILDPLRYLKSLGFEVTYLGVDAAGLINLEELDRAVRPDTIAVSIMAANNEIGVIQPLAEIGKLCQAHQVLFHTDAAQAIGKIPLNVQTMGIDLMSITGHKLYAPKGVGALYIRRKNPRVRIAPQFHGGGQERGFRSGTLYTPQIVALAKALAIAMASLTSEQAFIKGLRDQLWQGINQLSGILLNGDYNHRLAGNLNLSVAGVDGNALILGLQPVVAASSGSACSSGQPSHVLQAIGRETKLAHASVRFGIGRFNTAAEISTVVDHFVATVQTLRG